MDDRSQHMHASPTPAEPSPAFVSIGAYSAARGQDAPEHRHAAWKIGYYRTGHTESWVDGRHFDVTPGTVLTMPPYAGHAERANTAYSNYYLLLAAPAGQPWPAICYDDGAHSLANVFTALLAESSSPDEHSPVITAALVSQLDRLLRRRLPQHRPTAAQVAVRATEQLFEERYPTRLRMADVARTVGVSQSALRAHFHQLLGVSPSERLRQVRIRHALALLRTSDLPLAAVAARCGFDSASHLSRHVKTATGQAPGALRP